MTAYNLVLLAVETVPLLFYIFMGLVIVSVPVALIWEKYIQPGLDEKKKDQEEAEESEEEAEAESEEAAASGEAALGGEGELAMPAEGDQLPDDPFGDAAAESDAVPQDPFGEAAATEELGDVTFEEALPADAFTEDPEEKLGG